MSSYRYSISLRLWHPTMASEAMTEALTIAPKTAWCAGESPFARCGTTPAGIDPRSYWCSNLLARGAWPPTPLAAAVSGVLDRLASRRAFLRRVRVEGGTAELFIGWFFAGLSGDTLPHDLLGQAAHLGLDLSFDIYPFPAVQDGAAPG